MFQEHTISIINNTNHSFTLAEFNEHGLYPSPTFRYFSCINAGEYANICLDNRSWSKWLINYGLTDRDTVSLRYTSTSSDFQMSLTIRAFKGEDGGLQVTCQTDPSATALHTNTTQNNTSIIIGPRLSEKISPASWMKDSQDTLASLKLTELCLPGSHDSATCDINKNSKPAPDPEIQGKLLYKGFKLAQHFSAIKEAIVKVSVAQTCTIREQLDLGIRYLDMRASAVTKENGYNFWTMHGLYSTSLQTILTQVNDFLSESASEGELVIMDFQQILAPPNREMNIEEKRALMALITEQLDDSLIEYQKGAMLKRTYGELTDSRQGKGGVIVIFNYGNDAEALTDDRFWPRHSVIKSEPTGALEPRALITRLGQKLQARTDAGTFFVAQGMCDSGTEEVVQAITGTNLGGDPTHELPARPVTSLQQRAIQTTPMVLQECHNKPLWQEKGNIFITDGVDLAASSMLETVLHVNEKKLALKNKCQTQQSGFSSVTGVLITRTDILNLMHYIAHESWQVGHYVFFKGGCEVTTENGCRRLPHRVAELYKKLESECENEAENAALPSEILEILNRAIESPRRGRHESTSEFYVLLLQMCIEELSLDDAELPWNKQEPISPSPVAAPSAHR